MIVPPSTVDVTFAVFEIAMSAEGVPPPPPPVVDATVTDELAVLFDKFGSVVEAFSKTCAKFVIVSPDVLAFTLAAMTSVCVELAAISPSVHVPVELANVPAVLVALTNVRPEGSVSVASTPVEVAGPSALTVTV